MWLNARLTTAHKHAWWNIWHRTQRQGGINGELQEWTQRVWLPWVEAAWKDPDTRDSEAAKQRAQEAPTDVLLDSQPDDGPEDPQKPPRRYPQRNTRLHDCIRSSRTGVAFTDQFDKRNQMK